MIPAHINVPGEGDESGRSGWPQTLPDVHGSACRAVTPLLARIGDKWSVLVIVTLAGGPRRFNEIKRLLDGISQRMLTFTLRGLERDGLVTRTVTPSIPPRVDYALTDLGRSLSKPVSALGQWARANVATIEAARADFDRRAAEAE